MRTTPFRQIFNQTARWMGFNPNKDMDPDERDAIVDRINDRVRAIWSNWQWPEWNTTEQRAFRQIWNSEHQYFRDDGGKPDEVYYLPTESYYQVLTDLSQDPPIGTLPTDDNWWIEMDSSEVGTYIAYDQACRRSIGQVTGVFKQNPSGCNGRNGSAGTLKFHPSENGIEVCDPSGPTVYIQYKMPVPQYSMIPYAAGKVYNRADTVLDPLSGECFQALLTTINPPNTFDWSRMPFLEAWGGFVVSGAFADALNELDRSGNAETEFLEVKAVRAEKRADDALDDEVAALRAQGQMLQWNFCKRVGHWCESLPFSGGDVIELTDKCEHGIVFPVFPPQGVPPSGFHCPTPSECPDIAYLGEGNVFRDVQSIPGIRVETQQVESNFDLSVIDFAVGADATIAPRTINLPVALGTGQIYYATKTDSSDNPVTVLANAGDSINGDPSVVLDSLNANVLLIDLSIGFWAKMGTGVGGPSSGGNLDGITLRSRVVTADTTFGTHDFAIGGDATSGPIAIQLPSAIGSGRLYYPNKVDNTDEIVTVNRDGTDLIDGSISINFVEQYAGALLLDAEVGRWTNMTRVFVGGDIVLTQTAYPTPTTSNEIIACLQAAGLCAP